jgi:hypothetical protein
MTLLPARVSQQKSIIFSPTHTGLLVLRKVDQIAKMDQSE